MPLLRAKIGNDGPIVDLTVWVGIEQAAAILARGQIVPPPRTIAALVDTGADRSAIDSRLLANWGLQSDEVIAVRSSAAGAEPLDALVYDLQVSFGAVHGSDRLRWQEIRPVGVSIVSRGAFALIGRDLLATSLMIYDGIKGEFVISY